MEVVTGLAALVLLVVLIFSALSRASQKARLQGAREAADSLVRGVSRHYEHGDKEIPPALAKVIDDMKARVSEMNTVRQQCEIYLGHLRGLGDEMGKAAWQDGFEVGQRWTDPQKGEIRIDLTGKQLADVRLLAHFGFEHTLFDRSAELFSTQEQADAGARAIERLERLLPSEYRDESEPYALAINRQQLIWERWPKQTNDPSATPST